MVNKPIAAAVLAVLLAACANTAEKAAKQNPNHAPYCESLGYTPDSDVWRECIEQQQSRVPGTADRIRSRPY